MKKILTIPAGLLISCASAATTIHCDDFSVSTSSWSAPTGGSASTSSVTHNAADGVYELRGSHIDNPNPTGGSDAFFEYQVNSLDFGTGPVTVSFDGLLLGALPGTAIHVRINGNFFGAIQGDFNNSTYSNYSQTFDLTDGFDTTDTLSVEFQFAMGAVSGAEASFGVDNIKVDTIIPEPSTLALTTIASLALLRRRRS